MPGAMSVQRSSPIAFAPPTQAISSTLSAGQAEASFTANFCSAVTRYISRNMSRALLLPALSVPMASGTPARRIFSIGAIPLESLRLEAGFVIAQSFFFAKSAISSSLIQQQWKPPPP